MGVPIQLLAGTTTSLVTSGSSTVNNGGASAGSVANQTNLDELAIFIMDVAFGTAPVLNSPIDVYLLPIIGGTQPTNVFLPSCYIGSFLVSNQTASQRIVIGPVLLGPYAYNLAIQNRSGQTMSAGWSMSAVGYRRQVGS